jgi:hypothetical protein
MPRGASILEVLYRTLEGSVDPGFVAGYFEFNGSVAKMGARMSGIQFLTDDKGHKTAAVIDLKVHKALWEDIQDVLVSKSRRHERGVSLDKVKADLIASGKLRG